MTKYFFHFIRRTTVHFFIMVSNSYINTANISFMKQDKISGASEIEGKAMNYIKNYLGRKELFNKCYRLLSLYPSMASIWNIANFAFLYGKEAVKKFEEMEKANEKVIENGIKFVGKNRRTVLTYSRSSIISKILQNCNVNVICSEARPRYEGRLLAKELGNKSTLTTDAMLFSFVEKADFVAVGADAILSNGIVNKVGTYALALMAKEKKKPFVVFSSTFKTFPFVFIKEENPNEIWRNTPVKIKNIYFDFTPANLISFFITENGMEKFLSFKYEIADEIFKIRKLLKREGYYFLNGD